MSDIKPFSRLRSSLQNKLLQEAWYECYLEGRTIVRQGERPACFYIILSGTAVVTYRRITDSHVEAVDTLERGCTFGEKGIMTGSRQIFTVTSKTRVELLVLWKEDFKAIYMTEDRQCSKDDLKFLKYQVPFLRGFQIERLNDEFPHSIQHCNYRQSEVIAQDSRLMKHIFVVQKGSIEIWKRLDLHGIIPKLNKTELDQIKHEKLVDDNDDEVHEATADNKALFSEVQLSGDVDTSPSERSSLDTDFQLSRLRRPQGRDNPSNLIARTDSVTTIEKKFPGIADKRERLPLIDYEQLSISSWPNESKSSFQPTPKKRSRSATTSGLKFMLPNQNVYIHVKTLNQGQHVGLADMLFPNQPALTLIGNKCECLLLLKSSFVRIATDLYKQNIRRSEVPFPSDADFYTSYHRNAVWKRYSSSVYKDVCERMNQQHQQPIKRPTSSHQHNRITLDLISPV